MSDAELKEYRLQLESVEAALKADPENVELFALVAELSTLVAELGGVVKAPTEGQTPSSSANYPSSPYGSNGISRRDTPATPVEGGAGSGSSIYAVGDNVLARWTSGDNQLYPARITSVMGSQKNPVYIVKFTQYNATETLHPQHIKPANNANKKRKLENEPTNNASTTPTSTSNGAIISQPATINAELAEANKRKSTETLDGPQKPAKAGRKIAQNKVLEDGKKKWQNFAQKGVRGKVGKAKKIGESSMFRTPDGVHGRVGFTGSGQPMRKDATRGKHIYQQGDEEE